MPEMVCFPSLYPSLIAKHCRKSSRRSIISSHVSEVYTIPTVEGDIPFLFPPYAVAIGRIHSLVHHKMDMAYSIVVAIVAQDDR